MTPLHAAEGERGDRERRVRFVSEVSHGLKNSLAVIVGYAELLRVRDEETRREATDRIVEAAETLSRGLDDLMTVFAADADALAFEPVPTELEPAIVGAIELVEQRIPEQSFVTAGLNGDGSPVVSADAAHLSCILTTLLLGNRRRSTEPGEVEIRVRRTERFAEVSVSDPSAKLGRGGLASPFQPFADAGAPRGSGSRSTGLELYKVRRLVELHGGSIWLESEREGGATVTFTIPLADEGDES